VVYILIKLQSKLINVAKSNQLTGHMSEQGKIHCLSHQIFLSVLCLCHTMKLDINKALEY